MKVALTGDRRLYYLLCAYDPEFLELFKIQADFEDEVPRSAETIEAVAGLIATLARRESLRPIAAAGVARPRGFEDGRGVEGRLRLAGHR